MFPAIKKHILLTPLFEEPYIQEDASITIESNEGPTEIVKDMQI
jgi:hypothetical protein